MSDIVDSTPPQDNDDADRPPPPPAAPVGSGPLHLNPTAIQDWINGRREQFFNWLDAILSPTSGGRESWIVPSILPVADRLVSIGAGLIAMIMVDRYYGPAGLGIFAWYFSLLTIAGYFGRYGLPLVVENHLAASHDAADEVCSDALATLLVLGAGAVLAGVAAASFLSGPGSERTETLLYLLMGPTVLFQNLNALRLAMLNGSGRHSTAAGLKIRQRVVFLAATLGLCMARVPVSLLAGAFLISQVVMAGMGRKAIRLPALSGVLTKRRRIAPMLDRGRAYLFVDNLLDVVFYLDMLILGWFANPAALGIYARALILARLFLIIPGGLRPVFRRVANELVASGSHGRLMVFMARGARGLFYVHGLLAVVVLVHFQQTLMLVFEGRQWALEAFAVFALVLPGLIFYSAVTSFEPVYEATRRSERLKQINMIVTAANLILNINLIPFAGIRGAAVATAAAMVVHVLLFCRLLPAGLRPFRIFWPGAAAALYLTYVPLAYLRVGVGLTVLLAPILFAGLLWMTGFFNVPGHAVAATVSRPGLPLVDS